jgi:hypothetical protein
MKWYVKKYSMNHITLVLIAILAAATLVIAILAAAPAFARHSGGGNGNTFSKQKNKGTAIANGFRTFAENVQTNVVCINSGPCIVD